MVMPKEIEDLFADHPDIESRRWWWAFPINVQGRWDAFASCRERERASIPSGWSLIAPKVLPAFKVPKHVIFLEAHDIPQTPTGRPQKFRLAKLASERLDSR